LTEIEKNSEKTRCVGAKSFKVIESNLTSIERACRANRD